MIAVDDPADLTDLFEADRETHIYALGDLDEPYWSTSKWFRRGEAAVGIISTGDEWVTGYAMSRTAPNATLGLFNEVHSLLPPHSWVTGASGLFDSVRPVRDCRSVGPHWRMVLDRPRYPTHVCEVTELGPGDMEAMNRLHSVEPGRAFWRADMLADYPFVGVWDDGRLVASAGCHVASERHRVAAIGGVFVDPRERGRALGGVVTAELVRRLHGRFETIGLNVEVSNEPAVRTYDRLGFRRVFEYEEIELL